MVVMCTSKKPAEIMVFSRLFYGGESQITLPGSGEKIPNHPKNELTQVVNGCPFDCGLCANHRQEPCCVLLDVTNRCDLGCPVCFASAGDGTTEDPDISLIKFWFQRMLDAGGPYNIQLSGGEPCLRDDLSDIITLGKQMGFPYFQVNTNGLRIASDVDIP